MLRKKRGGGRCDGLVVACLIGVVYCVFIGANVSLVGAPSVPFLICLLHVRPVLRAGGARSRVGDCAKVEEGGDATHQGTG